MRQGLTQQPRRFALVRRIEERPEEGDGDGIDLYFVGRLGKEAIAGVAVAGNLTRLEQGRSSRPSTEVLDALAEVPATALPHADGVAPPASAPNNPPKDEMPGRPGRAPVVQSALNRSGR